LLVGVRVCCATEVAIFEAVAVALEGHDFGVVDEPVDHGCGDDVVAEDFAPPAERFVGRHDEAGSFVAVGHQLEEQVRGLGLERDIADFVDDEQRDAAELDQLVLEPAGVVGFGEARDPLGGSGEGDPMTGLACPDTQPDGQMGFAGARSDGDRLQQVRAALPYEVRVVAETHPLFGRLLRAIAFRRLSGSLFLVVELPDGSPGTIRADATDVLGELPVRGVATVLDGEGVRALYALVQRLGSRPRADK